MTYLFRKAAYQAVEQAESEGLSLDDKIVVQAPPGRFVVRLRDLKTMIRNDQRARRQRRQEGE